jgi:putative sigma-54 modulation protein
MLINIETQGIESRHLLVEHTKKRMAYALSHAYDHIERVNVRLSDINGPRGGIDKSCLLTIDIRGLEPIVVEDIQADIISAIDRAADRAGRSIIRKLEKHRHFARVRPTTEQH